AGEKVHPNDHVNMGQSSNDVFPTAIHLSAYMETEETLIPSLEHLLETIEKKSVSCERGNEEMPPRMELRGIIYPALSKMISRATNSFSIQSLS
ncbi:MAG: lyase family protein, partial [Candidatus Hodarchaeota archaeon]